MKTSLIAVALATALPVAAWSQQAPAAPAPDALRATVSQADFASAMAAIKPRADACASKSKAKGTVALTVKVRGSGESEVTVKSTPDPALGDCVAAAAQRASFPRSEKGGTFSHSFTF